MLPENPYFYQSLSCLTMPLKLKAINKHTLLYGASLAAILLLMQWLQVRYLIMGNFMDVYVGGIALLFTALGVWLALKLARPKKETILVEKQVYIEVPVVMPSNGNFVINEKALGKLGISDRELEVLQLMAKGMSSKEIADALFVSVNTVKTHSSNLFLKLDVNRRMQAVEKGRKLGLVS